MQDVRQGSRYQERVICFPTGEESERPSQSDQYQLKNGTTSSKARYRKRGMNSRKLVTATPCTAISVPYLTSWPGTNLVTERFAWCVESKSLRVSLGMETPIRLRP
jgi:hypothetical protein